VVERVFEPVSGWDVAMRRLRRTQRRSEVPDSNFARRAMEGEAILPPRRLVGAKS